MREQYPAPGGKLIHHPGQVLEPYDQGDLIEDRSVVVQLRAQATERIDLAFDLKSMKSVADGRQVDSSAALADRHLLDQEREVTRERGLPQI